MPMATLTSKGQVTIPKSVREELRLHTGDKVEFILSGGKEARLRPVTRKVDEVFGRLQKAGRKPVSMEALDEGIRKTDPLIGSGAADESRIRKLSAKIFPPPEALEWGRNKKPNKDNLPRFHR